MPYLLYIYTRLLGSNAISVIYIYTRLLASNAISVIYIYSGCSSIIVVVVL